MKRTRFLAFLLTIAAATPTTAAVGDTISGNGTYVVDGVSVAWVGGSLQTYTGDSPRLYDSTKGAEWAATGDSLMCWLHASSNVIQYWQSYYGVFAKPQNGSYYDYEAPNSAWLVEDGTKPLPYGKIGTIQASHQNPSMIPDARQLEVARDLFYTIPNPNNQGIRNTGGSFDWASEWFFRGADQWPKNNGGVIDITAGQQALDTGGYYANYFEKGKETYFKQNTSYSTTHFTGEAPQSGTLTYYNSNDVTALKNTLLDGFGVSQGIQQESGKLIYLSTVNSESQSGHALTCYGFTTKEDGSLKSILIADNNTGGLVFSKNTPALTELFISITADGKIALYKDQNCSKAFSTGDNGVNYVNSVSYINTPEVLKKMLAEYSDTTNEAQVWNGQSTVWEAPAQAPDTNVLPGESTGWDIYVDGDDIATEHHGYYHTYATDGRAVVFDGHAADTDRAVTINGQVKASSITIAADGYSFQGSGSIAAGADLILTNGASLDSAVDLNVNKLTLESGTTIKSDHAIVVTGDFLAALAPTTFTARSTVTPEAIVNATLDLSQADSVTLETNVNMNGNTLILAEDVKLILNMVQEDIIPCFTNINQLYIGTEQQNSFRIATQVYFQDAANTPIDYFLVYDKNLESLSLMLSIPEPGTATLSLLALAALLTRRRRH